MSQGLHIWTFLFSWSGGSEEMKGYHDDVLLKHGTLDWDI